MRVNKVIIATAGGGELCSDGTVDRLVQRTLDLKKSPILVLGPEGDDVLLSTRLVESCDLIFDPNYQGNLFSSVKAGLIAATGPAFVVPLSSKPALKLWTETSFWSHLETELDHPHSKSAHIVRPLTHDAEYSPSALLQIVTPNGFASLTKLEAQTEWDQAGPIAIRFAPLVGISSQCPLLAKVS